MKLLFKALEEPKRLTLNAQNPLGYSTIEILVHKYNGKKGVIVLLDNEAGTLSRLDLFFVLYDHWHELSNVQFSNNDGHSLESIQIKEGEDCSKHMMWLSKKHIRLLYYFLGDKYPNDLEVFNEIRDMLPQRSVNKILNDLKVAHGM